MKATLLGTASALPIPLPGCTCPQCAEARAVPARRRTRTGLRLEVAGEVVLVDAGPDLLLQLEREGLGPRVDRLVVTHTHADHVLGLDDLVQVRGDDAPPLRVHAAPYHREAIARMFPRLLREGEERIAWDAWEHGTRIVFDGLVLEGFETGHRARFPTTGVLLNVGEGRRARRVAFATDMGEGAESMPVASRERLYGIDVLVGDGTFLGRAGSGHPGTDAVLALARRLGVGRVAFTHVGHVGLVDAEIRRRLHGADLLGDGDPLPT